MKPEENDRPPRPDRLPRPEAYCPAANCIYKQGHSGPHSFEAAEAREEALRRCAEALTAIDEWLGQATTRQYADDAIWRARRALEAAGIKVQMNTDDQHWRGSVFRALEQCGLGWTGYEGEIRFRLAEQPLWSTAAGPPLRPFLDEAFYLLGVARGMLMESPANRYWLESHVAVMMGAKAGAEETVPIRCRHCGRVLKPQESGTESSTTTKRARSKPKKDPV